MRKPFNFHPFNSHKSRGASLVEVAVATVVLGIVFVGGATFVTSQNSVGKSGVMKDSACLNIATSYMNKIGEWGLPRHSMHLLAPEAAVRFSSGRWQRSMAANELLPGIDPAHQMPSTTEYSLIEKPAGVGPVRLRNPLLATGTMGALQAMYNSDVRFCTQGARAYSYVPPGSTVNEKGAEQSPSVQPVIPTEPSEVAWRGTRVGRARVGMSIVPYNINTGVVVNPCPSPPLILQPQAITEPPEAYRTPNPVAERGAGVRNDLGFLVTIQVMPEGADSDFKPCSLERKFQHQRLAPVAVGTPFSSEISRDDDSPECAMAADLATAQGIFSLDLKYHSRNEAKGAVLLCRDRSLRLKPARLDPDGETALRVPAPGPNGGVEACITTGNLAGGLSTVSPGVVTNCFVRRRPASNDPNDFYQATVPAEYAISRLGSTGANVPFVACEDVEICRVNGVGSKPLMAQMSQRQGNSTDPNDDELVYTLSFNLGKDQAGCYVHIETAQVDVAGNVTYGDYRRAFMSMGSPGVVSDGYCMDGNAAPLASNTAYANCYAPLTGMGDGNCPCFTDRYRNAAGACVSVGNGYYSVDDEAADDGGPVACTNGPGGATPATAAANNFVYTSSGRGANGCDWRCNAGYTEQLVPPACVPLAVSCPVGTTGVDVAGMCEPIAVNRCQSGVLCAGVPGYSSGAGTPAGDWSGAPDVALCGGEMQLANSWCCCPTGATPTPTPTPTATPRGGVCPVGTVTVDAAGMCEQAGRDNCEGSNVMCSGIPGYTGAAGTLIVRRKGGGSSRCSDGDPPMEVGYCCCPVGATPTPTPDPLVTWGFCFVAGTKVRLAAGGEKAIELVELGEEILTYDEAKQQVTTSRVSEIFHHPPKPTDLYTLIFSNGGAVTANGVHPFFMPLERTYRSAQTLFTLWESRRQSGQEIWLMDEGNELVQVTEMRQTHATVPLYNLHVHSPYDQDGQVSPTGHNYFAAGVLVHNAKCEVVMQEFSACCSLAGAEVTRDFPSASGQCQGTGAQKNLYDFCSGGAGGGCGGGPNAQTIDCSPGAACTFWGRLNVCPEVCRDSGDSEVRRHTMDYLGCASGRVTVTSIERGGSCP